MGPMGFDLKAGYILRGFGRNTKFELEGRGQQLYATLLAFLIAIPIVWLAHASYFAQGLVPPVDRVFVAAIKAGPLPMSRGCWWRGRYRARSFSASADRSACSACCSRPACSFPIRSGDGRCSRV
jgi:hypothetical protein